MVQFQRHFLTASIQYIGNLPEYIRVACSVIRLESDMEYIPARGLR